MVETLSLLDELFSSSGLLSQSLRGFESREGQHLMARKIWEAFEKEAPALFEAGTGIGKSLAYLIPVLLWSYRTGEKVVISTYTISLQEQLIEKDIPMLLKILGLDLRVVLAKGMGNYLCMKKLDEISDQHGFFEQSLDKLVSWSQKTSDGSRSSLPFSVPGEVWGKVYAESEACSYVKCPHYKQCFFFKGRSKVQEADVVIVNHHLLMAHLQSDENRAILPSFSRLIVDEAHHLENVARSSLMKTLDRVQLFRSLARVHTDVSPETSRLYHIRNAVKDKALKIRLDVDLPGEKRNLVNTINHSFDLLDQTFALSRPSEKWRITSSVLSSKDWEEKITPAFGALKDELERFGASLEAIEKELDDELRSKVDSALMDISNVAGRIKEVCGTIEAFFSDDDVRWAEKTSEGTTLTAAKLDVAPFLEEKLFSPLKSSILCSATLTAGENFAHMHENLGIKDCTINEIYPSPFDFGERARLMGPSDLPPPSGYNFIQEASDFIREAVSISGGGAFVLFTSYDMLRKCSEQLSDIDHFKQGDYPRHLLLEKFKDDKNAILLGTDSFWEGVDVPGEALRLVIIVKLPFPVPSDPLLQAKSEALKKQGRDPFMEDSVPQAVMKFKQGFGRLMRHKEDRGCVICLDQRLFNRRYGEVFLKSLPECITSFAPKEQIFSEMKRFYDAR